MSKRKRRKWQRAAFVAAGVPPQIAASTIKRVPISSLKSAAYNPAERIDPDARNTSAGGASNGRTLAQLARSIERVGLIYPIAVAKDMAIIDGHRRVAACKLLGWDEVPVIVVAAENADHVYAEVNANSSVMTGNQTLRVWMHNPGAVTPRSASRMQALEEAYGRELLERVAKAGAPVRTIQTAAKVGRYTDDTSVAFVRQATRWLIKFRGTQIVNAYMRLQQSPATLHKAITLGTELQARFSAGAKKNDK